MNTSHLKYLSFATSTIILALRIAHEFGLEMYIGLTGIQIQYGRYTDDYKVLFYTLKFVFKYFVNAQFYKFKLNKEFSRLEDENIGLDET